MPRQAVGSRFAIGQCHAGHASCLCLSCSGSGLAEQMLGITQPQHPQPQPGATWGSTGPGRPNCRGSSVVFVADGCCLGPWTGFGGSNFSTLWGVNEGL